MFNVQLYAVEFDKAIKAIDKAEKVTKETLKDLSRSVLVAVHNTGDIAYVNRLLAVLTPMNKRVVVLYAKEFTGFMYDDEAKTFTKKSKKHYDATLEKCNLFLEDPHNNVWTWQEKNVAIETKPFDLSKVTVFIASVLKKADAEGFSQADVLQAVLSGGVTLDTVTLLMDKMAEVETND